MGGLGENLITLTLFTLGASAAIGILVGSIIGLILILV